MALPYQYTTSTCRRLVFVFTMGASHIWEIQIFGCFSIFQQKIQRDKSNSGSISYYRFGVLFGNDISNRLVVAYSLPVDAAVEFPWLICDAVSPPAAPHEPNNQAPTKNRIKRHRWKKDNNRTEWFRLWSEFRISNFVQYARCSRRFNWRKHVPNEMHCYMCHIASFHHPIPRNARFDTHTKNRRVWFCPQETLAHMFPPHKQTDEKKRMFRKTICRP